MPRTVRKNQLVHLNFLIPGLKIERAAGAGNLAKALDGGDTEMGIADLSSCNIIPLDFFQPPDG